MSQNKRINVDYAQNVRENIRIPTRGENGRQEKGSYARWVVGYVSTNQSPKRIYPLKRTKTASTKILYINNKKQTNLPRPKTLIMLRLLYYTACILLLLTNPSVLLLLLFLLLLL